MIAYVGPDGGQHHGTVWAPGPADRSVWVLPDVDPDAPVLVRLVDDGPAVELVEYRARHRQPGPLTPAQLAEARRPRLSRDDWHLARFGPPPPEAPADEDAPCSDPGGA